MLNQSKSPWTRTNATRNGTYSNSWKCSVYSSSFYLGVVYGKTELECNANGDAVLCGGNGPIAYDRSFWNIAKRREIHPSSDAMIADLTAQAAPDKNPAINTTWYSSALILVTNATPSVQIAIVQNGVTRSTLTLHKELWKGVQLPTGVMPSLGRDGHIVIRNVENGREVELYQLRFENGKWQATWGGIIWNVYYSDGVVEKINNELWGATATSLPLSPGLIKLSDLKAGAINHVQDISIQNPSKEFISPALRMDGIVTNNTGTIPYGQMFQFPEDTPINPNWTPFTKMSVIGGIKYGFIVRDRSANFTRYAEDLTPYQFPTDQYLPFTNGKFWWEIAREFPVSKLKAVKY